MKLREEMAGIAKFTPVELKGKRTASRLTAPYRTRLTRRRKRVVREVVWKKRKPLQER